jgi:hypothetical protein
MSRGDIAQDKKFEASGLAITEDRIT